MESQATTREPHEHYTLWTGKAASRIDRFYVGTAISAHVQWEAVELPKRQSDHPAVMLPLGKARRPERASHQATITTTVPGTNGATRQDNRATTATRARTLDRQTAG